LTQNLKILLCVLEYKYKTFESIINILLPGYQFISMHNKATNSSQKQWANIRIHSSSVFTPSHLLQ